MGWYKAGNGKPVALSEFAPDKNVLEPGILLDAVGAQPTISGFSPMANLVGLAPALSGRAVGSFYAYYSNETATLFAAVDNGAGVSWFVLDTSPGSWVAVTGPTANPAVAVRFAQFGDDVLAVGNFASPDGVWIAPNKASNFVTIPGSPPNATVIVVAGLQVVVFVEDAWFSSAVGNDTDWVLSLATRADTGPVADAPGPVVAASALFRNIVAFKKNVTYLGQQSFPSAWDWQLISTETGTWSQGCVIQLPDGVAFLGVDDFYVITGYAPQAIPNNVKQWFFRNVDPAYIASTLGWYDSANSLLYWHFVSREAPNPPTCDRFVSYNRSARRWCVGRLDVSSVPYLGIAATSLPTPAVPAIVIDGEFIPKAFTSFPSNMVLTTGYYGEPTRLSQLMRVLPVYNRAPCVQTLTPLCTDVLGQPDKQSEPAELGVDGWFYTRQYERYHKLVLGAQGDCEITAIVPELREGGLWGYGTQVACPEVNLDVDLQFNPTIGAPDSTEPLISFEGTVSGGGGLLAVIQTTPEITFESVFGCPEDTLPDVPVILTLAHCYDYNSGEPPGILVGNSAGQVNFIGRTADGEDDIIVTVSNQDGFATDYATNTSVFGPFAGTSPMFQILHIVGNTITVATPVPLPPGIGFQFATQSSGAGVSGHSDEQCYAFGGSVSGKLGYSTCFAYFSWPDQTVRFLPPTPGFGSALKWAKRGDAFYVGTDSPKGVLKYSLATESFVASAVLGLGFEDLQATDNFLWGLLTSPGTESAIYKLDLNDMHVIASYPIGPLHTIGFEVVNDDLIYLCDEVGSVAQHEVFYYFIPSSNTLQAINPAYIMSCSFETWEFTNQNVFFFKGGYFYMSYGGVSVGATNLEKIGVLNCPGSNVPIGS